MEPFRIFIVEDDQIFAKVMAHHLSLNPEYEVETFSTGKECLENLYKDPSAVLLDYYLPGMKGLEILQKLHEFNPDLPVIIVSGQSEVSTAIELLKKGAYDYVIKDEDTKDRLWNLLKNLKERERLKKKVSHLEEEVGKRYQLGNLIKGESKAINKVFGLIDKAAKTNIAVSITGETGTGKELVAKSIHYNSPRRSKPFVPVNVTAIPDELIESEMFGHEKGAFTGANSRRIGKFEEANGGTLFLDEIADMDLNMQSKLLRVLQEEEVTRIGSNKIIKLDLRIIVASNKNLMEEVRSGNFREDLYYRLLGMPIYLPPLRERENDIFLLAKFFLDDFCEKNDMKPMKITPKAMTKLRKHPFPGNVRELKAVMELAAVMTNDGVIDEEDITFSSTGTINDFLLEEMTLEEYDQKIIRHFLDKYDNKVRMVAKKLGIGKTTIYRLMKENKV
ncbi:MAG: sigma-54 dependent transcriptional regulator [Bacteroidales bacterium]|nr:sigma-54 dependent transcriptional regulator [Bacteroidales bacterium]